MSFNYKAFRIFQLMLEKTTQDSCTLQVMLDVDRGLSKIHPRPLEKC